MKNFKHKFQSTNKSGYYLLKKHKSLLALFLLVIAINSISCKSDPDLDPDPEIFDSNVIYGINVKDSHAVGVTDSLVQMDLSKGVYKNLCSTHKFNLNVSSHPAYSRKLNIIAYNTSEDLSSNTAENLIGLIHLNDLTSEMIGLRFNPDWGYVKALQLAEKKNLLFVFVRHFRQSEEEYSLQIIKIDLIKKSIVDTYGLLNCTDEITTDIDESNNRIFIFPNNSATLRPLYIYNYETKQLTNQTISGGFLDIHYSPTDQCLIGSSFLNNGFGLLSYSIVKQKTDTIGKYSGIRAMSTIVNYFDKATNSYWLGVATDQMSDYSQLENVNLSNASFSRSFSIPYIVFIK